ncbi:unnamed protein product [Allacma fusca]|uniref:Golgi apparatus membrane protein TVP23 homolog n=1 Tax=Allacma fusca TaxID=39272 RepID=A0A8J2Q568_9HEXA|nr:unnamed protein product [Allacma fusca]
MVDNKPLLPTAPEDDDEGLGFGEEGPDAKQRLKHPVVAFFHILFRSAAILVYIFCNAFNAGFIPSFVTVVILLSLDFWTVKNITGRILVGLRWWNYVDENDVSHWVFESRKGIRAGGRPPEKRVFWTALIVTPVIWILLFFTSFFTFRFQWTILVLLALALQGANLYGYIRCKLGHTPGLSDAAGILQTGLSNIVLRRATAGGGETPSAFGTQQV